jgi:hypothetical protein
MSFSKALPQIIQMVSPIGILSEYIELYLGFDEIIL